MKNFSIAFYTIFLGAFFLSCDGIYNYSYKIENLSDEEIKVEFSAFSNSDTITIEVNQSMKILETNHGVEGGNGPHKGEITEDFQSINISIKDTIYSKRDFLNVNEWMYENGNYSIEVTNEEFK